VLTLAERAIALREEIERLQTRVAVSNDAKTRSMLGGRIRTARLRLGRYEREVRSGT
jgi:hypothetical protein